MPRRSRPYVGYEEKEARRRRQYNVYRRSFGGKLTSILIDFWVAAIGAMVFAFIWMVKWFCHAVKVGFGILVQGVRWLYAKATGKL